MRSSDSAGQGGFHRPDPGERRNPWVSRSRSEPNFSTSKNLTPPLHGVALITFRELHAAMHTCLRVDCGAVPMLDQNIFGPTIQSCGAAVDLGVQKGDRASRRWALLIWPARARATETRRRHGAAWRADPPGRARRRRARERARRVRAVVTARSVLVLGQRITLAGASDLLPPSGRAGACERSVGGGEASHDGARVRPPSYRAAAQTTNHRRLPCGVSHTTVGSSMRSTAAPRYEHPQSSAPSEIRYDRKPMPRSVRRRCNAVQPMRLITVVVAAAASSPPPPTPERSCLVRRHSGVASPAR